MKTPSVMVLAAFIAPHLAWSAPMTSSPGTQTTQSTGRTTSSSPDPTQPSTMPRTNPPSNISQPTSGAIKQPKSQTPPRGSHSHFPAEEQQIQNQQRPLDHRRPQEGLEREQEKSRSEQQQVKPVTPPMKTE